MYLEEKPYIVAELNSSHRGKVENAKMMIDAAKKCGCNAVKLQSWTADSLYCKDYYSENPISKRMVNGLSLKPESIKELAVYCHDIGIDFSSTPYSREEVDFMVENCKPAFIKVASMDINNIRFLKHIAEKHIPVVLSTGMATMDEIEKAVETVENEGNNQICILHCVSLYPAAPEMINLNNMVTLQKNFTQCHIGYSDHTLGSEVACAATALGATLIEKHFTLDNSVIGWDNQMATEPDEMEKLISCCRNVYASLGSFERNVSSDEMEQCKKMRRSIVAARDLENGQTLEMSDMDGKRPGTGIDISQYERLVGKKINCKISKGAMITEEMIDWSEMR
jgi:N-acetylneuraminate synthase